uniref:Proteasome maturation factor UMP1 n=1 Tax=Rhodosorus marinus TaxID=101924 RepID=A0A7S2ZB80_9RHOD|mmetsp:Transcript_12578/g.51032  ORF Transcript_12578/g.51032 Transcript_12578/m.51032 type:complete len:131 (+) Transcript_12578:342-734(+)
MDDRRVAGVEEDRVDVMRDGLSGTVKAEFGAKHPVQERLGKGREQGIKTKREMLAATYGTYFPTKLMIEQEILSSFHRLPGLESEYVGLETLSKRDLDISFCDVYGRPEESPEFVSTDLHHEMEKQLKLK